MLINKNKSGIIYFDHDDHEKVSINSFPPVK